MRRRDVVRYGIGGMVVAMALVAWSAASARWSLQIPVGEPLVVTNAYAERTDHLRRNETLSHMFARHNIDGVELTQLLEVARPEGLNPRRISPSRQFEFRYVIGQDKPNRVRLRVDRDAFLRLDRRMDGHWESARDEVQWTVVRERVSGEIRSSFNNSIHRAIADSVLPANERGALIDNIDEDVFGWVINFMRDNRPGDRFDLLYERLISSVGDNGS